MEIYKDLFYRLYKWNVSAFGKEDLPALNALLEISLVLYGNLISIYQVIKASTGFNFGEFIGFSKLLIAFFSLCLLAINYFLLVYNGKLQRVIEQRSNESPDQMRNGDVRLGIYIMSSLLILFISIAL